MYSAKKASQDLLRLGGLLVAVFFVALQAVPLQAANSDVSVQVCPSTPYPAPTITSPADGTTTTNSSIIMSGQATPGANVFAYRNNTQVGFVPAAGDGTYTISISLVMGANELKASTNNDCSAPAFSGTVEVTRESVPPPADDPEEPQEDQAGGEPDTELPFEPEESTTPSLPASPTPEEEQQPSPNEPSEDLRQPRILQPKDGARFTNPDIIVTGMISPNTMVQIQLNDEIVASVLSDEEGRFTVGISLEPGANELVAIVGSGDNAQTSRTTTVFYDPVSEEDTRMRQAVVIATITAVIVAGVAAYSVFAGAPAPLVRFVQFIKGLFKKGPT